MSTSLLIGCPTWKRDWILRDWFFHAERAAKRVGIVPEYAFVADYGDSATVQIMKWAVDILDRDVHVLWVEESEETPTERTWNPTRYERMVYLRNKLLSIALDVGSNLFLSLDSDILLHVSALESMMEGLKEFAAVGGKCYMTEPSFDGHQNGTECPSWVNLDAAGGVYRQDHSKGIVPVDIIMAVKLMTPAAYNVAYQHHYMGEDFGWSLACKDAGLPLGFDGRVTNKHVLTRSKLHLIDKRCGY